MFQQSASFYLNFFFFPLTPLAAHSRNTDFRFSLPILLFLPSFESDHLFTVVDFFTVLIGGRASKAI